MRRTVFASVAAGRTGSRTAVPNPPYVASGTARPFRMQRVLCGVFGTGVRRRESRSSSRIFACGRSGGAGRTSCGDGSLSFILLLSGIVGMTTESGESFFGLSSDRCCSPGVFRFCPGTNGKSLLKRSVSLREEAPEKNGSRGENRAAAGFSFGRERGLHATGRNGYFLRICLEQTGSAPDVTFCHPCRASGVPDRGRQPLKYFGSDGRRRRKVGLRTRYPAVGGSIAAEP